MNQLDNYNILTMRSMHFLLFISIILFEHIFFTINVIKALFTVAHFSLLILYKFIFYHHVLLFLAFVVFLCVSLVW